MAAWDVSSDVWIIVLLVPFIWKLNLRAAEIVMLTGMFCLGAVYGALLPPGCDSRLADKVRSVVVFSLMSCSAISDSLKTEDVANEYTFAMANLFQVLEAGMGIIGSCLPIMRQPLRHCFPGMVETRFSRKRSGSDYYSDQEAYVLQHRSNRSEVRKDG
ncbi:hypothetical protein LTR37_003221 [Vermiconidia calcicola]|uniref:Uncharacterized protein n=1 Tax=Vermiconidia calcicola TaxID=1690605 RepID=A0ACC3NQG2_9PEZI|nr:hypothetical protein LTR37_003221 [Vermiconidia calcicola]